MSPIEECKKLNFFQIACVALAVCSMAAGVGGLVLSFLYLASSSMENITAGSSGFIAGSVLIGAGLVSLAIVSRGSH
jgi:ABC-type uncharacterized transport system permease subunit